LLTLKKICKIFCSYIALLLDEENAIALQFSVMWQEYAAGHSSPPNAEVWEASNFYLHTFIAWHFSIGVSLVILATIYTSFGF
jgi:hypothetical protein